MATTIRELDLSAVTRVGARRWQVASRTTPGEVYTVVKLGSGRGLQCNCAGAVFGGRCWHVAAVAEFERQRTREVKAVAAAVADTERAERIAALTRQAAAVFMTGRQ